MALENDDSHAAVFCASSKLPTLSEKARSRAAMLRRLADDLDVHDGTDMHGDKRLVDVFLFLQDEDAGFEVAETMRRLGLAQEVSRNAH